MFFLYATAGVYLIVEKSSDPQLYRHMPSNLLPGPFYRMRKDNEVLTASTVLYGVHASLGVCENSVAEIAFCLNGGHRLSGGFI